MQTHGFFEFAVNLQSVRQKQTLNGAVTKVKVLGKEEKGSTAPIEFEQMLILINTGQYKSYSV